MCGALCKISLYGYEDITSARARRLSEQNADTAWRSERCIISLNNSRGNDSRSPRVA